MIRISHFPDAEIRIRQVDYYFFLMSMLRRFVTIPPPEKCKHIRVRPSRFYNVGKDSILEGRDEFLTQSQCESACSENSEIHGDDSDLGCRKEDYVFTFRTISLRTETWSEETDAPILRLLGFHPFSAKIRISLFLISRYIFLKISTVSLSTINVGSISSLKWQRWNSTCFSQ